MASKATASATHSGWASVSRSRTWPSPGASSSTRPTTASAATIWSVRLASRRGSNSSGIVTPAAWSSRLDMEAAPVGCRSARPEPPSLAAPGDHAAVCASRSLRVLRKASEKLGNGWMTSNSTESGTRARIATVACWSHSPASGPSA